MRVHPGRRNQSFFSPFLEIGSHGFTDSIGAKAIQSVVGLQLDSSLLVVNLGKDSDYPGRLSPVGAPCRAPPDCNNYPCPEPWERKSTGALCPALT